MSSSASIFLPTLFATTILFIQIAQCGAKIKITQMPNGDCLVESTKTTTLPTYRIYNFHYYDRKDSSIPYQLIYTKRREAALIDKSLPCKLMNVTGHISIYGVDNKGNPAVTSDPCRCLRPPNNDLLVEFKQGGKLELGKRDRIPMKLKRNIGSIAIDGNEYLLLRVNKQNWAGFYLIRTSPECPHYKRQRLLDFGRFNWTFFNCAKFFDVWKKSFFFCIIVEIDQSVLPYNGQIHNPYQKIFDS